MTQGAPNGAAFSTASLLQLAPDERGVAAEELRDWERQRANLLSPHKRIRVNAWIAVQALERRWAEAPEQAWRARALAETVALAKARGVEIEERPGGRIVLSSDGLKRAHDGGLITSGAYQTGLVYRACYERRHGETTPARTGMAGGRREGPQHALLAAMEVLDVMRRGATAREAVAMDLICGAALMIGPAAKVMGVRHENALRALKGGLTRAAVNWEDRPKSRVPERGELARVRAAVRLAERAC